MSQRTKTASTALRTVYRGPGTRELYVNRRRIALLDADRTSGTLSWTATLAPRTARGGWKYVGGCAGPHALARTAALAVERHRARLSGSRR